MSNLGIALLSLKNLPQSLLSALSLCWLHSSYFGSWYFLLPCVYTVPGAERTSATAELALFITPQINSVGEKVGAKEYKSDTSPLGLSSAPSLLAALSLFSSKGSRLFLPLACQHQMTFELC